MINVRILFYKDCCTYILERAVEIFSLSLLIVNAVVEDEVVHWLRCCQSNLSPKQRRKDFGKRRKMMASMRSTPFSISQVMFAGAWQVHKQLIVFQVLAFLWNELPTACMCVIWPLTVHMWLCMAFYWLWVSKRSCITQVTAIMANLMYSWRKQQFWNLPYLAAMWRWPPKSGAC